MNDLIVVPQANQWLKLKRLVLDSVSSPITRRVYNLGLDEFFAWYPKSPARLHQSDGERLARCPGSPRAWRCFDQRPHHGGSEARGRSRRQRAAGAGAGERHLAREGRRVQGRAIGELALRPSRRRRC